MFDFMFKGMQTLEKNSIISLVTKAYIPIIKEMIIDFDKVSDFRIILTSPRLCLYPDMRKLISQIIQLYVYHTLLNESDYFDKFVQSYTKHYRAELHSTLKRYGYETIDDDHAMHDTDINNKLLKFSLH